MVLEERQMNMSIRIGAVEQKVFVVETALQDNDRKIDQWVNRGMGAWAVLTLVWAMFQFGSGFFK